MVDSPQLFPSYYIFTLFISRHRHGTHLSSFIRNVPCLLSRVSPIPACIPACILSKAHRFDAGFFSVITMVIECFLLRQQHLARIKECNEGAIVFALSPFLHLDNTVFSPLLSVNMSSFKPGKFVSIRVAYSAIHPQSI